MAGQSFFAGVPGDVVDFLSGYVGDVESLNTLCVLPDLKDKTVCTETIAGRLFRQYYSEFLVEDAANSHGWLYDNCRYYDSSLRRYFISYKRALELAHWLISQIDDQGGYLSVETGKLPVETLISVPKYSKFDHIIMDRLGECGFEKMFVLYFDNMYPDDIADRTEISNAEKRTDFHALAKHSMDKALLKENIKFHRFALNYTIARLASVNGTVKRQQYANIASRHITLAIAEYVRAEFAELIDDIFNISLFAQAATLNELYARLMNYETFSVPGDINDVPYHIRTLLDRYIMTSDNIELYQEAQHWYPQMFNTMKSLPKMKAANSQRLTHYVVTHMGIISTVQLQTLLIETAFTASEIAAMQPNPQYRIRLLSHTDNHHNNESILALTWGRLKMNEALAATQKFFEGSHNYAVQDVTVQRFPREHYHFLNTVFPTHRFGNLTPPERAWYRTLMATISAIPSYNPMYLFYLRYYLYLEMVPPVRYHYYELRGKNTHNFTFSGNFKHGTLINFKYGTSTLTIDNKSPAEYEIYDSLFLLPRGYHVIEITKDREIEEVYLVETGITDREWLISQWQEVELRK